VRLFYKIILPFSRLVPRGRYFFVYRFYKSRNLFLLMPFPVKQVPLKTILNLVKLIHFSRRIQNSVKKMHSRYHRKRGIQYFKSAVKNSVLYLISAFQLSSSMVKTIQSLVKKIQTLVKTIQMRQSLLKWS